MTANRRDYNYPIAFSGTKNNSILIFTGIIVLICFACIMFFVILGVILKGDYQGGRPDYEGQGNFAGLIGGFICCTGFPLAACAVLWIILNKQKKQLKIDRDQWMMFHSVHLAKKNAGRISMPELIVNLQVTAEEGKRVMDELVMKGVFEVMITPSGAMIYQLVGFDLEKAASVS